MGLGFARASSLNVSLEPAEEQIKRCSGMYVCMLYKKHACSVLLTAANLELEHFLSYCRDSVCTMCDCACCAVDYEQRMKELRAEVGPREKDAVSNYVGHL